MTDVEFTPTHPVGRHVVVGCSQEVQQRVDAPASPPAPSGGVDGAASRVRVRRPGPRALLNLALTVMGASVFGLYSTGHAIPGFVLMLAFMGVLLVVKGRG